MNADSSRWRRLAVTLAQHAARILPGARSPWADAMRHELDYIEDDPAALRWALGCVLTSYRTRLTHRPSFSPRVTWRQVAASGALMVLIGLALQENAGGKTEPPRPPLDERTCDLPGLSPETRPHRARIADEFIDQHPARVADTSCADRVAPHPSLPKNRAPQ